LAAQDALREGAELYDLAVRYPYVGEATSDPLDDWLTQIAHQSVQHLVRFKREISAQSPVLWRGLNIQDHYGDRKRRYAQKKFEDPTGAFRAVHGGKDLQWTRVTIATVWATFMRRIHSISTHGILATTFNRAGT
jgi:hypothetical protein